MKQNYMYEYVCETVKRETETLGARCLVKRETETETETAKCICTFTHLLTYLHLLTTVCQLVRLTNQLLSQHSAVSYAVMNTLTLTAIIFTSSVRQS